MKIKINIFTLLKKFLKKMIIRVAQIIENQILSDYYVNYKFTSIGGVHKFELPIIFEVRNEEELNLLHMRVINGISNNFIPTNNEPMAINKHKKLSLLKEKASLKDSGSHFKVKFMQNINGNLITDADLNEKTLYINVISPKKDLMHKKINPYGPISGLIIVETDNLK